MKNHVKVQRHFKCNREYVVKNDGIEVARYAKFKTISGYACIGMYGTGYTNYYEDIEEHIVDIVLLCWVSGTSISDIYKIQFE